jgi:hypothetical protein
VFANEKLSLACNEAAGIVNVFRCKPAMRARRHASKCMIDRGRCGGPPAHVSIHCRKTFMKIKQFVVSTAVAFGVLAMLAPTIASAAPHRAHKVCKVERHHHRVCHWVR